MTTTYDPATESLDDLTGLGGERGPKHYFGEIAIVDDFDCVLRKGAGKVPFDPGMHRADERLVALKIKIVCAKADGSTYDLDQDDITSGSKHKVTLGSLKEHGVTTRAALRGLPGKFCQAVRVETGRKYAAKKDSADGSIRAGDMIAEQALKFLALYDSAEACQAAEREFYKPKGDQGASFTGAAPRNAPQPVSAADMGAPGIARETLLATLPAIVQAVKASRGAIDLQTTLNGNPAYAQAGITAQSPEVVALTEGVPF